MVRFARAEGSKGSNKRQLEEPTPWNEMVTQISTNRKTKKGKVEHNKMDERRKESTFKKNKKGKNQDAQHDDAPRAVTSDKTDHTKQEKEHHTETVQNAVQKKGRKKKGMKTSEPEYTITEEGKRVKVFRNGVQRTWFDLPYEDGDRMTRYEGMWVKKEMVSELDRLKTALQEENLNETEIMRKMMKAKRKAHRNLRIELIYEQKDLVSKAAGEEGGRGGPKHGRTRTKERKSTKPKKNTAQQKPLHMGNNPVLFNGIQTQNKKIVFNSDDAANSRGQVVGGNEVDSEDDGNAAVTPQTCNKQQNAREAHGDSTGFGWRVETCDKIDITQVKGNDGEEKQGEVNIEISMDTEDEVKIEKTGKKSKSREVESEAVLNEYNMESDAGDVNMRGKSLTCATPEGMNDVEKLNLRAETSRMPVEGVDETFQENDLMTNYEGYWVLRKDVQTLDGWKEKELNAVLSRRREDTDSKELTEEEQCFFRRAMKKRKRFYHTALLKRLHMMGKKVTHQRKDKNTTVKDNNGDNVVRFDGFWIKKEAADRLHTLRKKLQMEGLSQEEVSTVILKERRKEERLLKNERKLLCLNCRQPGHMVSACPNLTQAGGEGQALICYTCGSTEHTSSSCNLRKDTDKSFSFATCYICGEAGHISRQCPDNPRGLYPRGGACRGCGSVEHLAKDCPDLQIEKGETNVRVGRLKGEELETLDGETDDDVTDQGASRAQEHNKKPKVVEFC